MNELKKMILMRCMKLLNLVALIGLFVVGWHFFYGPWVVEEGQVAHMVAAGLVYLVLVTLLGRVYNAFDASTYRVSQLAYSQGLTEVIAAGIAYVILCVIKLKLLNPLPMLVVLVAQILWSVLWSLVIHKIHFALYAPRKTVIIYREQGQLRKLEEVKQLDKKFSVTKYVQATEDTDLLQELEEAEAVFITGLDMAQRNAVEKFCINRDIQCYIQPRVGDVIMAGAEHIQMFAVPIMRVRRAKPNLEYLIVKRLFDIFVSALALLVLSPIMLVTALAIKLQDGGPVLYKQVRLTRNSKRFKVLKFRSMRTDAEKDGVARLSTEHDDRITPVGRLIRKIRVDELPQLINILRGDMTIVGPRPERPEIAEQYEKEIPSFRLRLQVKAGLTGYAQIYGRYNTEPYDKLKMDLMYINNMSITEDLRLMFATVKVLFMAESTEGIQEGQVTASRTEEAKEQEELPV